MGESFILKTDSLEINTNPLLRLFVFASTVLSKEWHHDLAFQRVL
jgi:hypothetical protein